MGLPFVFKLSLYLLTGFVGLALGMAEHGPIPFFSVPVTIFAYWWCEAGKSTGKLAERSMDETIAVILGIVGLGAAAIEFFTGTEGKLLAGIHLVVYLTWIMLLQQKSVYRCWLLLALGVVQVAVGSVLTNASWYGLCMVIYLFSAIWTLSVFSMYRAAVEFAMVDADSPAPRRETASRGQLGQVFSSVRFEDSANWISMRLVSGVIVTSQGGLIVGAAFFALIPRVRVGSALGISEDSLPSALRSTGVATEIKLGDMGPILNSNDPALTIQLFNNQTNKPIELQSYAEWLGLNEPLFRTGVLNEYLGGKWRPNRIWNYDNIPLPGLPNDDPAYGPVPLTIRQEVHLERIGTDVLPCMGRPLAARNFDGKCAKLQPLNTLAERRDRLRATPGAIDYVIFSEYPDEKARKDVGIIATAHEQGAFKLGKYMDRCRQLPDGLDRLRRYTRELIDTQEKNIGREMSNLEVAQLLEAHLRDSGKFTYSLDMEVVDPQLDPVEDFLFNRRTGHCQYFASALALMYRAAEIPSRLVIGFKGGERQSDGTWKVEKRFAHAWVEVWIENRKWMTFDATPEDARAESISAVGTKRSMWSAIVSKVTGIWESNVLDISYERQENMIYEPMREWLSSTLQAARGFVESPWTSLSAFLMYMVDPRNWLSVQGGAGLVFLGGLLWLVRRKTNWLSWLGRKKRSDQGEVHRRRIEFYERFVRLMQTHGRQREVSQTQAEFVREMAAGFAHKLSDPSLEAEIESIGDLFYLVRFGDEGLSVAQSVRVDDLLSRLEVELNAAKHRQQSA